MARFTESFRAVAITSGIALWMGCGEPARDPEAAGASIEVAAGPNAEEPLAEAPEAPLEPSEPAPMSLLPPAPAAPQSRAAAGLPVPGSLSASEPPLQSPAEPVPVPLEKLLQWKTEYRRDPVGLRIERPGEAPVAKPDGKASVRVRHHSEQLGPKGRTVGDAEVGVAVPVDESVRLKGGVRVDYDQDAKKEQTQMESNPSVGIEVDF